ncbi:MAG: hypothetical protein UEP31_06450 [Anaerovoracaceae bacterium]|nr:hypothetical protein [Anaerovoracaceae bacterium]
MNVSERTEKNIQMLRDALGNDRIFGRSDVMNILGITASPASALIKNMVLLNPKRDMARANILLQNKLPY